MNETPDRPYNLFLEMKGQEWAQWQHNPITAAYLQFMDDQLAAWREGAAELLEAGAFRLGDAHEDRNPDVLRGKLIALRQLRGITLETIQGFYGQEPAVEAEPESEDE